VLALDRLLFAPVAPSTTTARLGVAQALRCDAWNPANDAAAKRSPGAFTRTGAEGGRNERVGGRDAREQVFVRPESERRLNTAHIGRTGAELRALFAQDAPAVAMLIAAIGSARAADPRKLH